VNLENPIHSHKFLGKVEKFSKQKLNVVDNPQACKPKTEFPKEEENSNLTVMLLIIPINSHCAIYGVSIITYDR
jgi:hypothetical protein